MNSRFALGFLLLLAYAAMIQFSTSIQNSTNNSDYPFDCPLIAEDATLINLTWTSRWSLVPQHVGNFSSLFGDHVILNSTYTGLSVCTIEMFFDESNITVSNTTRSVCYDTYQFVGNSTQDVYISVLNALNESIALCIYKNVSFGNWFSPLVSVNYPIEVSEDVYNFTWSSSDLNVNDTNFYQVWLSTDGGHSYQLLANNLTQTFYLWDSTGFLHSDYRIRIRAFSVDVSVYAGPYNDIPADYWPGDYGDGFIDVQIGDGIPWPAFITIVYPSDMTFHFGELGKHITWNLIISSSGITPSELTYIISRNGSRYKIDTMEITDRENQLISLNLDEFSVGLHIFILELSYVHVINTNSETVRVQILPPLQPLTIFDILLFVGAGGIIAVIVLSIGVYIQKQRIRG